MKRTVIAILALALVLTGCGKAKHIDPVTSLPDNAAEATVPAETTPPRPIAERIESLRGTEDTCVFDELGVLNEEERGKFDSYLADLSAHRQICAAVVLTDSLGGETPEDFACEYYRTLFGTGTSGFLLLINNDSGRDLFYCEGACRAYLSDPALQIAQATPLLVEGKYADALEILLPVGEIMPDRVLDRAAALTDEQTQSLCERADALDERRTLLLTRLPGAAPETTAAPETSGISEETAETAEVPAETVIELLQAPAELQTLAEEVKSAAEADVLLAIDVTSGTCVLLGEEGGVRDGVQHVLQTEGVYAAADYYYRLGE